MALFAGITQGLFGVVAYTIAEVFAIEAPPASPIFATATAPTESFEIEVPFVTENTPTARSDEASRLQRKRISRHRRDHRCRNWRRTRNEFDDGSFSACGVSIAGEVESLPKWSFDQFGSYAREMGFGTERHFFADDIDAIVFRGFSGTHGLR